MATNAEYNRMIEDYLSGDLSGSEKEIFENQLSSDPVLQSELNHQSEIIEGLESFRKAELKTRLTSINVNPTILGVISQSAAIKTAAVISTAAIIATGTYYFNSPKVDVQLTHVEPIYEYVLDDLEIPPVLESMERVSVETIKIVEVPISEMSKSFGDDVLESDEPPTNVAAFDVPDSPGLSDSEIIPAVEDILENSSNDLEQLADVVKLDKVEVENIVDKAYAFHYRYTNSRLYLYGSFDKSPYEIIEINAKNDKRLYFCYQDNYYQIEKNTTDITAFEKITDLGLIKELAILKAKQ